MKKIIIFILVFLIIIVSIFAFYIYSYNTKSVDSAPESTLKSEILNNSTWISLNKEDLNGYLNGTYTKSILSIINSLEEAIPVIFQITSSKFSNIDNGIFIVASAFNTKNQVYVYYYNPETNSYNKTEVSLEYILEDATSAFIYNGMEGL